MPVSYEEYLQIDAATNCRGNRLKIIGISAPRNDKKASTAEPIEAHNGHQRGVITHAASPPFMPRSLSIRVQTTKSESTTISFICLPFSLSFDSRIEGRKCYGGEQNAPSRRSQSVTFTCANREFAEQLHCARAVLRVLTDFVVTETKPSLKRS
jgi:hypothetical protein